MMTRGDIARALLALGLAGAAWLGGGCLDSIVSAECAAGRAVDGSCLVGSEDPPDAGGGREHDHFVEGQGEGGVGAGPDAGGGGAGGVDAGGGSGDGDAGPEEPLCEDGLERCAGECVDLMTDPMNCGHCMNQCDSGVCQEGICMDATSGHVILIGHDFTAKNGAIGRLLGNSVFLALGDTVDVVAYRGSADPNAFSNANQSVSSHAASIGRSWNRIAAATAAEVPGLLAAADVFLVYDQGGVDGDGLADLGASWAEALGAFTAHGGIVIALDGGGTWQILSGAGLLDVTGTVSVSGQVLEVTGASDAVGANVPVNYWAAANSVAFTGTTAPVVVETTANQPVIVHRPVF